MVLVYALAVLQFWHVGPIHVEKRLVHTRDFSNSYYTPAKDVSD